MVEYSIYIFIHTHIYLYIYISICRYRDICVYKCRSICISICSYRYRDLDIDIDIFSSTQRRKCASTSTLSPSSGNTAVGKYLMPWLFSLTKLMIKISQTFLHISPGVSICLDDGIIFSLWGQGWLSLASVWRLIIDEFLVRSICKGDRQLCGPVLCTVAHRREEVPQNSRDTAWRPS